MKQVLILILKVLLQLTGLALEVLLLLILSLLRLFMRQLMLQITISETDLRLFQLLRQILLPSQVQEVVCIT